MTAPQSVVEAVAKAVHDAQDTGYEWDTFESSWWDHAREEARGIADAAWAAAYPAALRDAADRWDADIHDLYPAGMLRRWADESGA